MAFGENGFALARRALPAAGLKPVVSLGASFASLQDLTRLRELGYSYLTNLTRGSRQNAAATFSSARLPLEDGRDIEDPQAEPAGCRVEQFCVGI